MPKAESPCAAAATEAAIDNPAAMLFDATKPDAAATDAPAVGIARAAPCAIVVALLACVFIIVFAIP